MAMNAIVPAKMAASTTSIGSNRETVAETGPAGTVDDMARDVASPAVRTREENRVQSPAEMERFWFPSITAWYGDLNKRHAATVLVLCFCNLINYMDRSTVAGMIDYIRHDSNFHITSDTSLGLLQTSFVVFYTIFAPLFGVLGDRYNRKWILGVGLTFWSLSTVLGSFCTNFWLFMFFRALVGIGEASYSTIAPAIISDLYVKDTRSKVLVLFYFAVPVGTGLGYIIGSEVANGASDWRWGLRVTPFMGLFAIFLIAFVMKDPPRGQSEGSHLRSRSTLEDLRSLGNNKSFCLSCVAFTCVAFCVGALMWWGPNFAFYGAKAHCGAKAMCEKITQADISYKFGIVMTFAGLAGVPIGSYVAQAVRHKIPNADPIVCGTSLLLSVPILYFGFIAARYDLSWCYGLTFLAGLLLNCNWAIVSDMTLYIVVPIRRSFASATQILVSHAFGDAISPYLIGAMADAIKTAISDVPDPDAPHPNSDYDSFENSTSRAFYFSDVRDHTPKWYEIEFRSLQYSLFICCFFQTVGGFFFLVMSWYVLEDKAKATAEASTFVRTDERHDSESGVEEDFDDDRAPIVRNTYADDSQTEEHGGNPE